MKEIKHPIFFSVSSSDISFAEEVWDHLPDDWVYLYSKTGEEAVDMWEEISGRELPKAKIVVFFWSRNFLKASGCIKEILQAEGLIEKGLVRPLILRLDDCPLSWSDEFGEETRVVFNALQSALGYRTSHAKLTTKHAIELVLRISEPLLALDHPRLPRPNLLKAMRASLQHPSNRFKFLPTAWIAGFNGVGRETLVKEYNRDFIPNGHAITIEMNEATLPMQLLLRIESEALGVPTSRLDDLRSLEYQDAISAIVLAIDRVAKMGNYIILRHGRIVEERVDLPDWLDDVVMSTEADTKSKLFIVSQLPPSATRAITCRNQMAVQRIPTTDEDQLKEFCYDLIAHFDQNPERWTDDTVEKVAAAARGTIGLLVSLVRAAARMDDLDDLDALIAAEGLPTVEQITLYTRWAFSQLRDSLDEQRILVFLNDVSPCDVADLERIVNPKRPILRALGKLLNLGLVERESDNLYRLAPLLSNRLSRDLLRPDLLEWQRSALVEFAKSSAEFETPDHEFLRIEARILASLLSGEDGLSNDLSRFVSAAHWFQAGVRLYHANRRDAAYRLLRKAFESRAEFAQSTRVEIIRYFCLSATRVRKYKDSEKCILLLNGDYRTKAMAAFLTANLREFQGIYGDAIDWYEKALLLNRDKSLRLEHTYRPLIACILRTARPDFEKAKSYALQYIGIRRSVFSLMALARVYLHWKYRGANAGRDVPRSIDSLYAGAFADLAGDPGVKSAHFEIRAEEAEFEGDFSGALEYMDLAISVDPRPLLRMDRWKLMVKSRDENVVEQALTELEQAKAEPDFLANSTFLMPPLAEIYARGLRALRKPLWRINQFAAGLSEAELNDIVARSRAG